MNPNSNPNPNSISPKLITLNIGGILFQTTLETLIKIPPNSFLSTLINIPNIPFIDRDPQLFSIILSFLRTNKLPPNLQTLNLQTLISEFQFYGIEQLLLNSINNPLQFNPYTLQKSSILPLNGRDYPSAIGTTSKGDVFVAHGCKISTFDLCLTRKSTILTQFIAIDSLVSIAPKVVAAGAIDFPGLQIIDVENGRVKESLNWVNSTRSSSNVQALGLSDEFLFTSFESSRRNSNAIVVYDVLSEFRPVFEIGCNEIYGAEFDCSSIPASKLRWDSSRKLLLASGSHSGPNGVLGSVKLWDVRSNNVVWETEEKVDCFADIDVSSSLSCLFKVGVNSSEMYYMDLRKLGGGCDWVCLGNDLKSRSARKEGLGCRVECHGSSVFVSRGGEVEVWSEIVLNKSSGETVFDERVFKRNVMGRAKDMGGNKITNLRFGGNKMFVTRKDEQFVEVWQSLST